MANIVDSYSETNKEISTGLRSGLRVAVGQSITGNGETLDTCEWYVSKTGSPTGNAVAKIYNITGTHGTDAKPTGSVLATSDNVDVSTVSANPTFALKSFAFSGANRITLTNSANYIVTIEYSGGSVGNNVNVGKDDTSPSHAGNSSQTDDGSAWITTIEDYCFYVYSIAIIGGGGRIITNTRTVASARTVTTSRTIASGRSIAV